MRYRVRTIHCQKSSPLQPAGITPISSSVHQPNLPVMKSLFDQFVTVIFFTHALEPKANDSEKARDSKEKDMDNFSGEEEKRCK